jgi:Transposase DDE domain group 1
VFGRLAGYEDVNDAERLRHDPAMRWIIGGKAAQGLAASPSQMGRFETQWLAASNNLAALADLSGQWIDLVHGRRPPRGIVLDMDSSVSPTFRAVHVAAAPEKRQNSHVPARQAAIHRSLGTWRFKRFGSSAR